MLATWIKLRDNEDWPLSVQDRIRHDRWHGVKPAISRVISLPVVNPAVRAVASLVLEPRQLHRLPFRAAAAEYALANGSRVALLNPCRDQVAKDILWGGGSPTSPADLRLLRYVEDRSLEIDTFLDIGAYSGLFAMIAARARPRLKAIAFEILPENHAMTVRNVRYNGLAVDVRLCGVSDQPGSILMPRGTYSAAHPSSMSLAAHYSEGIEVPVVTIDSLALTGAMLWKIDVEGFEWNVIQGARQTIKREKPDIICEVLRFFAEPLKQVEAFLKPLGYRFYACTGNGFEERPGIKPGPSGVDWVFTSRLPPP